MTRIAAAPVLHEGDRIFRYEVPVDDEWHQLTLAGHPLAVACRSLHVVEFWCRANDTDSVRERLFTVAGTGQLIGSPAVRYWGTAIAPDGHLVWHLLERVGA